MKRERRENKKLETRNQKSKTQSKTFSTSFINPANPSSSSNPRSFFLTDDDQPRRFANVVMIQFIISKHFCYLYALKGQHISEVT